MEVEQLIFTQLSLPTIPPILMALLGKRRGASSILDKVGQF